MQGKTVLLTGATGFLGGALAARLSAVGAQVRALVRRPDRDRRIKDLPNVTQVTGDVTDLASLRAAASGCDYAIHAAVSYGTLAEQRAVNVEGTRHVAQACAEAGVARLLHVSSLAAYGYAVHGVVTEARALRPSREPYSLTKAEAEAALRDAAQAHGLSYSIVRAGGIYGAHSGLWTLTLFKLAKRQPIVFLGDGRANVPLVYVDDLIDLMLLCLTEPRAHNEAFNAVYDPPYTWRDLLMGYARLKRENPVWLGIPLVLVKPFVCLLSATAPDLTPRKALKDMLGYLLSDVRYSAQKAHDLLGWQPKTTLYAGIEACKPYLQAKGQL